MNEAIASAVANKKHVWDNRKVKGWRKARNSVQYQPASSAADRELQVMFLNHMTPAKRPDVVLRSTSLKQVLLEELTVP